MERVNINADYSIKLPEKVRKLFHKGDSLVVTVAEDTLRLKRIKKKELLDRASEVKDKTQPSPEELNRIIHEVRRASK